MHYIPMNPLASSKSRAWAVSGVAVYPWAALVKQFINASQQLDLGDSAAMQEFILKGLNEPWSEDVIFDQVTNPTGDYKMTGEAWSESDFAAMTIDVQELAPYFWFVIRDWTKGGKSRLRLAGPRTPGISCARSSSAKSSRIASSIATSRTTLPTSISAARNGDGSPSAAGRRIISFTRPGLSIRSGAIFRKSAWSIPLSEPISRARRSGAAR